MWNSADAIRKSFVLLATNTPAQSLRSQRSSVTKEPKGRSTPSQGPAIGPYHESVESTPHPLKLKLSSYLRQFFQVLSFLQVFPLKPCYALLSSLLRATWLAHFIPSRLISGEEYRSWSSSLRDFLPRRSKYSPLRYTGLYHKLYNLGQQKWLA